MQTRCERKEGERKYLSDKYDIDRHSATEDDALGFDIAYLCNSGIQKCFNTLKNVIVV